MSVAARRLVTASPSTLRNVQLSTSVSFLDGLARRANVGQVRRTKRTKG